ncbi:hypothetical protein [Scytonema millei]|uniref:Uncharacterized protein n=1 Tax=Scytonema millei VB511283 TaxID=1245923 RepID=A0A9X5E7B2_9CYAN|nr:hypothetical protein [Scytonema millei]NHC36655.1 hypothetical protein [Scytonema millei VB511283]
MRKFQAQQIALAASVVLSITIGSCHTTTANNQGKSGDLSAQKPSQDFLISQQVTSGILAQDPKSRDKWLWPFSSTSIWNMPIGATATYVPANLPKAGFFGADREYFYKLKAGDPMRPVLSPGSFGPGRCTGKQSMGLSLPIPDNLIVPDATSQPYSTPNNAAAFLMPDGRTIEQLEPLARCTAGGNVHGWRNPWGGIDIYGDGIKGTHFGSGMSAIGGSIRRGELTSDEPIRHAIKILVWGKKYLHYSKSMPGYRWPADRADRYAESEYKGTNSKLVQGSLLAIPAHVKMDSLGLKTPAGQKIFKALQNYGAYIVDDAYWDAYYLAVEQGVPEEFRARYGYSFEGRSGAFYDDMMKLMSALHIIDNNRPDNIGGGGRLRAPLAPPIEN